jgi:predicted Rossmann fold nucleotide-binding protein DprA/Smf involved in DNA uptake
VDHIEIDVIETESFQRAVERVFNVTEALGVIPDLGRDKEVFAGNARGADATAQNACLAAGGSVISIVADSLADLRPRDRVLYLSEDDFDAAFSAQRALSRNRCIHAMGQLTFVAQADLGKGGTWDGTVKNLRHGWSNVAVFRDGSDTARELEQLGAYLIGTEEIKDCAGFTGNQLKLWD